MNLQRLLGRKAEDRTLTAQNIPSVMLSTSTVGSVTPSNATSIGDAYACIRVLADAAASVPLIPYRRTAQGRERIESGRTFELLRSPAPAMSQSNLIGQVMAHLQTHGNAYVGKFRSNGQLVQLGCLAPDRIQTELKRGMPVYTLTDNNGERSTHGPDDIIHIKGITTDGVLGLSPVRQARTVLGLSDQLAEHAAAFFENDARPAGVLKLQRFGDSAEQVADLRTAWNDGDDDFDGHKGTSNAHRIAVLAGEVDFIPISMNLDDAQFLEQRKLSAVEVARIFRVPPHMIGADTGESMTYSNLETAAIEFVTYSLRPWLVAIEQAFTNDPDLFPTPGYAEFLLDGLLRADSATRAEVYTKALDPLTGWMTREEVRRLENLDPEPAIEEPTVPSAATNGAAA